MRTRTTAILAALAALAAVGAGCHPAVEPEMQVASCQPATASSELETEPSELALLGEVIDGAFVPFDAGQEVEAGPNPLDGGEGQWVVQLRLGFPRAGYEPTGRQSCSWARTNLGLQGALLTDSLPGMAVTEPLLFSVGTDLSRLDGQWEVSLEATHYPLLSGGAVHRATARVRPVNRRGYLSGN